MDELAERRYKISEVSTLTGVAVHVLRRWDRRFPQLTPKRDRANRRYYMPADIEVVRRIKQLLYRDKMTTAGAVKQLDQERYLGGRPNTKTGAMDLLDKIAEEARGMLEIIGPD